MDIFPYEMYGDWEFDHSWENTAHWGRGGRCQVVDGLLGNPVFICRGTFELPEDLGYPVLTWLENRRGAARSFFMRHPNVRRNWDLLVGIGNGATLNFVTPFAAFDPSFGPTVVAVNGTPRTNHLHYSLGRENRLLRSTDFSNATVWAANAGATVTRTSGRASPVSGVNDAWRIQTSGGSSATKLTQTVLPTGLPSGTVFYIEVYIKPNTANDIILRNNQGNTFTVSGSTVGQWTRAFISAAYGGSANPMMAFSSVSAGTNIDFDVWHPWMAWPDQYGETPTTSLGYVPTAESAIIAASGKRLTLGFVPGSAPPNLSEVRVQGGGTVNMMTRIFRGPSAVRPKGLGLSFDIELRGTV